MFLKIPDRMTIRTRLALRFTFIVASILVIFALVIYYFSATYRSQEFYSRLNEKAQNAAKLLIEVKEVDHDLLKIIDKNTASLPEERVIIYNYLNQEIYKSMDDDISPAANEFLDRVRLQKEIRYMNGHRESVAILYTGKYDRFVVLASAYDRYGLSKLANLRLVLIIGLLSCVIATTFAGWIYAGQALQPISGVVSQVDKITASSLSQRVSEGNGTDEIAQLAVTFNRMLDRIESAFELQKSFVANASHELRTPLTAISGQLEVALMSDRGTDEYKAVISSVFEDIKNVSRLTNGLIELAQANIDSSGLRFRQVRMDELLWQTRKELVRMSPGCQVDIKINELPEEENKLIVIGNEGLLRSALFNIMENGCKFSPDRKVMVDFRSENGHIYLSFRDEGIGISEEDQKKIFQPFYRGSNAKTFPGHGIGLSLAQKIIAMHGGSLAIDSKENTYTAIHIQLPLSSRV